MLLNRIFVWNQAELSPVVLEEHYYNMLNALNLLVLFQSVQYVEVTDSLKCNNIDHSSIISLH